VGLSTRVVSASVHYIRRERGRCLTRGRRFRAGVNKLGKTEPETGRRGAEREWNPAGLGGPTVVGSNRETNGDRKFFERLRRRAGRRRQPTGTQISGGKGFGSPSATLQEIESRPTARDAAKSLIMDIVRQSSRPFSLLRGRLRVLCFEFTLGSPSATLQEIEIGASDLRVRKPLIRRPPRLNPRRGNRLTRGRRFSAPMYCLGSQAMHLKMRVGFREAHFQPGSPTTGEPKWVLSTDLNRFRTRELETHGGLIRQRTRRPPVGAVKDVELLVPDEVISIRLAEAHR
jgi:hypothetical protein